MNSFQINVKIRHFIQTLLLVNDRMRNSIENLTSIIYYFHTIVRLRVGHVIWKGGPLVAHHDVWHWQAGALVAHTVR